MKKRINTPISYNSFIWCMVIVLITAASCRSSVPNAIPIETPSQALTESMAQASTDSVMEIRDDLPDNWWTLFNDRQLTEFVETSLQQNPDLLVARARIDKAAYDANVVRSALFPYVQWGADVSRQRLSETGLAQFGMQGATGTSSGFPVQGGNVVPVYFTQYETELTLTYDFDVWGKNRNNWISAIDQVKADIADEAFASLQLGIAVAQVYFQLQIDYKRQELAQALVENKKQYLQLTQHRETGNLDNADITTQSGNQLAIAQEALLQVQGDIAINEFKLKAYLANDFEDQILNTRIVEQPLPKIPIPVDLPMHLISRRPDITAQLWLIESAGRQVEVARAGFYPDFNLFALGGFQSLKIEQLFLGKSTYFNVDPAVTLPIFDAGRILANLNERTVDYNIAIFEYNSLVLNAARDVLTAIAVLKNAEQQLQEFHKMADYQERLYQLTKLRIEHNINSNLDLLNSEYNYLIARDQEFVYLGNTLQAILLLIKALGGGYNACYG